MGSGGLDASLLTVRKGIEAISLRLKVFNSLLPERDRGRQIVLLHKGFYLVLVDQRHPSV